MARTPPCGDPDCPTHRAFDLFGRAHALDLLFVLVHDEPRPWRFNALKERLGIQASVLSDRLKELQEVGLVVRTEHDESPRRIEYQASPDAAELNEGFAAFKRWGARRHRQSQGAMLVATP